MGLSDDMVLDIESGALVLAIKADVRDKNAEVK